MFRNVDRSVVRVFVGVNHNVRIYLPDPRYIKSLNRGDKFVCEDTTYLPAIVYDKMQTLSLDTITNPGFDVGDLRFFMPQWKNRQLLPNGIYEYDVIVVSDMYANDAILRVYACGALSDADFDFLDRLYKVGPKVYDADNKNKVIGTVGLEKVVAPNGGCNPNSSGNNPLVGYLNAYKSGRHPSISAVMQYMNLLRSQVPNITLDASFNELYSFVYMDIQSRLQTSYPYPYNRI